MHIGKHGIAAHESMHVNMLLLRRRLVDGRSHLSPWGRIFSEEETDVAENNCAPLTRKEFKIRVQQLTPQMCMGPPTSVPHDEPLAEETLDSLWGLLAKDEEELTPSQVG
jgi:hypothetical protein